MATARIWNNACGPDDFGSVGCLATLGGQEAVMSACHVLCPTWRNVALGSRYRLTLLGRLFADAELVNWSSPLAADGSVRSGALDAAIGRLAPGSHAALIASQGLPAGLGKARSGQPVRFNGARGKAWCSTTVDAVGVDAQIIYGLFEEASRLSPVTAIVSGMIRCPDGRLSQGGDSGCLLVDEDDLALGLLVGSDPANTYSYFAPLDVALQRFGAELLTRSNTPGAPPLS